MAWQRCGVLKSRATGRTPSVMGACRRAGVSRFDDPRLYDLLPLPLVLSRRSAGRIVSKLATLLDTRLERRCGPVLVRWLYLASLAMVMAVTLFGMLMSWWLASWAGWGFWMGVPISAAGGLVWALGARLVCEQLIRWTDLGSPVAPDRWAASTRDPRIQPVERRGDQATFCP